MEINCNLFSRYTVWVVPPFLAIVPIVRIVCIFSRFFVTITEKENNPLDIYIYIIIYIYYSQVGGNFASKDSSETSSY